MELTQQFGSGGSTMAAILMIDDDQLTREAITSVLRTAGHNVRDTHDGRRAVNMHREEPAQLVITDILMPEFDGIELIRQLRKADPAVKIVAISGGGWAEPEKFLTMAQRLGADATLSKPFEWDQFLQTITALTQ